MRTPPPGPEWVHASYLRDVVSALLPADFAPEATPQANQPKPPPGGPALSRPLTRPDPMGAKPGGRHGRPTASYMLSVTRRWGVISVRRYLVVANQTLGGPKLADKLWECMSAGPCRFYLVVPATPTSQFLEPISQPLSLAAVDGGGGMLPDYRKIAAGPGPRPTARSATPGPCTRSGTRSPGSRPKRSSCPPFPTACRAGWSRTCHTAHGAPDSR